MTKRALITGAAGFVGRHLGRYLGEQGIDVHGLDLPGVSRPLDSSVAWHSCDITQAAQVADVVDRVRPEYVFHLAALIKSRSVTDLLTVNVGGTQNVLDALLAIRPDARVLVAGSSAEYGLVQGNELLIQEDSTLCPLNLYGISKIAQGLLATRYFYCYGLSVVRTRTFNLVGPGEPDSLVCSAFARQIIEIQGGLRAPVLEVGNLESVRDFLDVRDAVRAYFEVAQNGRSGEVYNVCSGVGIHIQDVLDLLFSLSAVRAEIKPKGEFSTVCDVPRQVGDHNRLSAVTGWRPSISLSQSLMDLLLYWQQALGIEAR